jgi:uncharacterized RDD family membrane protein YckC
MSEPSAMMAADHHRWRDDVALPPDDTELPPSAPSSADPPGLPSPLISWTPSGATDEAPKAGPEAAVQSAATTGWQIPVRIHAPDPERPFVVAGIGTRLVAWLVDVLILAAISAVVLIAIAVVTQSSLPDDLTTIDLAFAVLVNGLQFLYFVGFWTSSSGATPGMRLVALRIVTAPGGDGDGGLAIAPAIIRWAAFGYPLTILTVMGDVAQVASWGLTAWSVILLLTTIVSDTNQGIHDRLAGSAVMQRSSAAVNGAMVGCLVGAMVMLVLFVLLPIAALALLGDQLEQILSEVGQSI